MKKTIIPLLIMSLLTFASCGKNTGKSNNGKSDSTQSDIIETTDFSQPIDISGDSQPTYSNIVSDTVTSTTEKTTSVSTEQTTLVSDTKTGDGYGHVDSQIAIGSTVATEPGQTVDPLDRDGDGWIDIYV